MFITCTGLPGFSIISTDCRHILQIRKKKLRIKCNIIFWKNFMCFGFEILKPGNPSIWPSMRMIHDILYPVWCTHLILILTLLREKGKKTPATDLQLFRMYFHFNLKKNYLCSSLSILHLFHSDHTDFALWPF